MSEEDINKIYNKLQQHLDKLPIGFPQSKSGSDLRVLKSFFSPEEAQLATMMSFAPLSISKIHSRIQSKLGWSQDDVKSRLETMADKGTIFEIKNPKASETLYMNAPMAIGFFELSIDNISKEKAEAVHEYMREAFMYEFTSTKIPQMRTIPIEAAVTPDHPVLAYDDIWNLVEKMHPPYVVAPCVCTQEKNALGEKCKHELINRCIVNNRWYLDHGHGKEITKDELIALIKQGEADGLVIQPGNFKNGAFFCMCCNCCCGILSTIKEFPNPADYVMSNHYSEVDTSTCTECGTCASKCPMGAITLQSPATVDLKRCIGCGVCVGACPQEAIHLNRKANIQEPPETLVKLYEAIWKKKIKISPFKKKIAILKEIMSSRK